MEYVINDFLKTVYKPGELEDPYKADIAKITRKKSITLDEFARYMFLKGCQGFWSVNMNQAAEIEEAETQDRIREKIPAEEYEKGIYNDWTGLLTWCRCFVLSRSAYETAALNHIATLRAYLREDSVLRLWAGDLINIRDTLHEGGVDVDKWPGLWDLPTGLGYGFYLGDTMQYENKVHALEYAKKSLIAMINFLTLGDVFLDMLGKALKFDPSAFKTNANQWNKMILDIGGVFCYTESCLLYKMAAPNTPPKELERLKETKALWRGILDEIRAALSYEWTAKELKPLKDRLKKDPFHFYEVPTDVDFILEIFGAEKDY